MAEKRYSNREITVIWKSGLCTHSANCIRGLPGVFNLNASPWVNMQGASTDVIAAQVRKCPSGALSIEGDTVVAETVAQKTVCEVVPNGPIKIQGPITIKTPEGEQTIDRPSVYLCRCGLSTNKPFCDGAHKTGFVG